MRAAFLMSGTLGLALYVACAISAFPPPACAHDFGCLELPCTTDEQCLDCICDKEEPADRWGVCVPDEEETDE